jgi:hypothetical protein
MVFGFIDDLIEDPIKKIAQVATQPIRDGAVVFQGMTEGELRTKAALRLGADAVSGMALSEIIETLNG